MSTPSQPIYNRAALRTNIREVARQVLALRSVANISGYQTGRTIQVLLDKLNPTELIALGEVFLSSEKTSEGKAGE